MTTTGDYYHKAIAELAAMVDVWQRMLAVHTRDADGFCADRSCGRSGTGTPYVVYPCPSRLFALRAQQQHQATR